MRQSECRRRAGAVCGAAAHAARAAAAGQRADGARGHVNDAYEVAVVADVHAAARVGGNGGRNRKQGARPDGVKVARPRAAAAARQRGHGARGNVHGADEVVRPVGDKERAAGHGEAPRCLEARVAAQTVGVAAAAAADESRNSTGGDGDGAHRVVDVVRDKDGAL